MSTFDPFAYEIATDLRSVSLSNNPSILTLPIRSSQIKTNAKFMRIEWNVGSVMVGSSMGELRAACSTGGFIRALEHGEK